MATYRRNTAASIKEVLATAEQVLTARLPIRKTGSDRHSITLEGGDGKVKIVAHKHGLDTAVEAATDQLRTSRIDVEVQHFMAVLPYEPKDVMPSTVHAGQ